MVPGTDGLGSGVEAAWHNNLINFKRGVRVRSIIKRKREPRFSGGKVAR